MELMESATQKVKVAAATELWVGASQREQRRSFNSFHRQASGNRGQSVDDGELTPQGVSPAFPL